MLCPVLHLLSSCQLYSQKLRILTVTLLTNYCNKFEDDSTASDVETAKSNQKEKEELTEVWKLPEQNQLFMPESYPPFFGIVVLFSFKHLTRGDRI